MSSAFSIAAGAPDSAIPSPSAKSDPAAPAAQNFRITDDHLGEGGPKLKYARNVAAIRLLKRLEDENRLASPQEQKILSSYVGWGSLADAFDPEKAAWAQEYANLKELLTPEEYAAARASVLNAHYTSPIVIRAIYEAVGRLGFRSGNILEPAMGVGNFFGCLPEEMRDSRLYGVELDSITGRMAKQLYPNADITVAGFETTDRRDFYDLAIGNVPFGSYQVNDRAYNKLGFSIHNYFFAKAIDQVRPGGIIAFVTSRYTIAFPKQAQLLQSCIQGCEQDIRTAAAHSHPKDGFAGMTLLQKTFRDKQAAGKALLDACKHLTGTNVLSLGSYRGFDLRLEVDALTKDVVLTLQGAMPHRVELGSDAKGNLLRIDHALDKISDQLSTAAAQLADLHNQTEAARAELQKPFPQEAELAQKSARLIELNALLDMDGAQGFQAPEQADSFKRMFEYLCRQERVSRDVVQELVTRKILYESVRGDGIHSACFLQTDASGQPCGAMELRLDGGGWTMAEGSDPARGFLLSGSIQNDAVTVFATPLDAAKHLTDARCVTGDLLALGSLDAAAPLLTYLQEHPGVMTVRFGLGAEPAGRDAVRRLLTALPEHIRVIDSIPAEAQTRPPLEPDDGMEP